MPSRVGERGQITVEKAIREELAVYAGDQAIQWVEDGRLVVEFVPAPHRRSLAGSLAGKVTRRPADEEWPTIREAARSVSDPDRAAPDQAAQAQVAQDQVAQAEGAQAQGRRGR